MSFGPFLGSEGETGNSGGAGSSGTEPVTGGTGSGKSNDEGKETGGTGKPADDIDSITDPAELRRRLKNAREAEQRIHGKMTAAEKERDELARAQTEAEEKARRESQSEVDNLKEDVRKRDETIKARDETIRSLTVQLAFAKVKDVEWHDQEDALRLVDLSDVEYDEKTGGVKDQAKVVAAAKNLAKAKPHLVKKSTVVSGSVPTGQKNGSAPAGGQPTKTEDDELIQKYKIRR
jgi:hypothetical protein